MASLFRPSFLFSSFLLGGCGLALGLDDFDIVETETTTTGDGDGDNTSNGDGDVTTDVDGSSGGRADPSETGGSDNLGGSTDGASGGAPPKGSGGEDTGSGGKPPVLDCENDHDDEGIDTGCDAEQPMCINGSCAQCAADAHCADDGHACSVEHCEDGTCKRTYEHNQCDGFDDPCLEVTCSKQGCASEDISEEIDLLDGEGDFEATGGWGISGSASLAQSSFNVPAPHGGSYLARFTNGQAVSGNIYSVLNVPEGTQSIAVDGYYRSYGSGDDHADDYFRVGFWDGSKWYGVILDTKGNKALAEVSQWTQFSGEIAYDDLLFIDEDEQTVEFDLFGITDGGTSEMRHFFADDVRLMAKVCSP